MTVDAPWAYFILMLAVLALASLSLFRFLDGAPAARTRHAAVDGLRGFLALGVFVFHLVVTHGFIATGRWEVPDARFYALLGPVGVSVFFMITGFLFWGKLLRTQGRPDWFGLYIGRLFRIGPMYVVVVLVMLGIVFARTGLQLLEPVDRVAGAVLQWLALGFIDTQPDVNGYAASHVLAGVTWTIWYEWMFYAALVAIAPFARGRARRVFVPAALVVCLTGKTLLQVDAIGFALLFVCGMAVASLLHANRTPGLSPTLASSIALACVVLTFAVAPGGYGTFAAVLLSLFFYLVCSGTTVFGLLTTRAAQRLGTISYSLYLMQGLVLTLVFAPAPIRAFAMASAPNYWAVGIACAGVLLLAAALGYAFIERPAIAFGKQLSQRTGARTERASLTAR
jgi:peptidoglycan/LPS O-acetylase OafA/YrhL